MQPSAAVDVLVWACGHACEALLAIRIPLVQGGAGRWGVCAWSASMTVVECAHCIARGFCRAAGGTRGVGRWFTCLGVFALGLRCEDAQLALLFAGSAGARCGPDKVIAIPCCRFNGSQRAIKPCPRLRPSKTGARLWSPKTSANACARFRPAHEAWQSSSW